MSADNGLTLIKEGNSYILKYWSGESEGEYLFGNDDLMEVLAYAEREMRESPVEYNLSLRGFTSDTYSIVRFYRDLDKDKEIILDGLTLEEAQAYCNREDTRGATWFDGYEKES